MGKGNRNGLVRKGLFACFLLSTAIVYAVDAASSNRRGNMFEAQISGWSQKTHSLVSHV